MYQETLVPWVIELDSQGHLMGFVSTSGGGSQDRGRRMIVPHPGTRAFAIKPNLLADKAEYVLGLNKDGKTAARHRAFKQLVQECASITEDPGVKAVYNFLERFELDKAKIPEELTPDQWVTFRVDGYLSVEPETVRAFWAKYHAPGEAGGEQQQTNCIVCNTLCSPVKRHPVRIKGIPDGQTSGLALVSANSNVFESYGLKASLIAPTCATCAEQYATGANDLLRDEVTRVRIGPLAYLFWTKQDTGFSVATLFSDPQPQEVERLIRSAWRGREHAAVDAEAFYATALSASGARVVVRDWLETTVGAVQENLGRWFVLQELVKQNPDDREYQKLWGLVASLYQDARKQMVPGVPQTLLRVALKGGRLPEWLLHQAVQRNRVERKVTRPRAVLIKMVLLSHAEKAGKKEGEALKYLEQLDAENIQPAYLCGRLLAELDAVQRAVMPKVNTTMVDRFFGTASTAPAAVFGHLLRGTQNHLAKLRKEKPGTYHALQRRLEEIQFNLADFPAVLSLQEQGLFALGYYHQRAANRMAAQAHQKVTESRHAEQKNQKERQDNNS
jgi:CRISPR-associated protein Csd1